MEGPGFRVARLLGSLSGRRTFLARLSLLALAAGPFGATLLRSRTAYGFAQEGAFHPRILKVGRSELDAVRKTAPGRWAWELVRRTSAPGRLVVSEVAASDPKLLQEPFVVWSGGTDFAPLTTSEVRGLRQFLSLGGFIFVDDNQPGQGGFGAAVRRELLRVLPEAPVVRLDTKHVIYKSYYLLDRPVGRVIGVPYLDAVKRGQRIQVLLSSHDLLGALARQTDGAWALDVEGGAPHRQQAIRLAVNIAMYLLCSDYKDDQVHAEELMRRRGRRRQ